MCFHVLSCAFMCFHAECFRFRLRLRSRSSQISQQQVWKKIRTIETMLSLKLESTNLVLFFFVVLAISVLLLFRLCRARLTSGSGSGSFCCRERKIDSKEARPRPILRQAEKNISVHHQRQSSLEKRVQFDTRVETHCFEIAVRSGKSLLSTRDFQRRVDQRQSLYHMDCRMAKRNKIKTFVKAHLARYACQRVMEGVHKELQSRSGTNERKETLVETVKESEEDTHSSSWRIFFNPVELFPASFGISCDMKIDRFVPLVMLDAESVLQAALWKLRVLQDNATNRHENHFEQTGDGPVESFSFLEERQEEEYQGEEEEEATATATARRRSEGETEALVSKKRRCPFVADEEPSQKRSRREMTGIERQDNEYQEEATARARRRSEGETEALVSKKRKCPFVADEEPSQKRSRREMTGTQSANPTRHGSCTNGKRRNLRRTRRTRAIQWLPTLQTIVEEIEILEVEHLEETRDEPADSFSFLDEDEQQEEEQQQEEEEQQQQQQEQQQQQSSRHRSRRKRPKRQTPLRRSARIANRSNLGSAFTESGRRYSLRISGAK